MEELRKSTCPEDESQFVGTWKPIHISTHIHWKAMSADLHPHNKLTSNCMLVCA
jgi:hypothetical protein